MTPPASHIRPRLRGVLHQYAFLASLAAAGALLVAAPTHRAAVAAGVYGGSLVTLFGTSTLFHRVTWSVNARRWMARLDHASINLLIAGTITPIAVLVVSSALAGIVLTVTWGGAAISILLHVLWIDVPKWLSAILYVAVGWTGTLAFPEVVTQLGWAATLLLVLGGILYSVGAAVYALRRPDPAPTVFGYHEVFHALVIAAAAAHYVVVAFFVLPVSSRRASLTEAARGPRDGCAEAARGLAAGESGARVAEAAAPGTTAPRALSLPPNRGSPPRTRPAAARPPP